nr:mucin-2-like [Cherax quadricarinatus]XP_053633283.1 mucin-2-like [Cherax quadricarinatus]
MYITPCWTCYSYSHSTADCHVKNKKICSTCGSAGHDFLSCTSTAAPTCINCKSDHHTLAAKCPVRKDILSKKLKEETKNSSGTSPTYAAIAKIQSTTSKILQATQQSSPRILQASTQPSSTVITPPTCDVTKIHYCLLYAHMQNMAVPGSFNSTINELFALNNLPSFTFPASPPSEEILKFTKNLIANSSAEVPSTPPTSDVNPTTTNEKPPPPPPLTESNQSEALPPETSSNSSTEVENEATPPSSTPPPPSLLHHRLFYLAHVDYLEHHALNIKDSYSTPRGYTLQA